MLQSCNQKWLWKLIKCVFKARSRCVSFCCTHVGVSNSAICMLTDAWPDWTSDGGWNLEAAPSWSPWETIHTITNDSSSWLHHCSHHSLPHRPALSSLPHARSCMRTDIHALTFWLLWVSSWSSWSAPSSVCVCLYFPLRASHLIVERSVCSKSCDMFPWATLVLLAFCPYDPCGMSEWF